MKFVFSNEMDTQLVQKYKIDIKKEIGPEQTPVPGNEQHAAPKDNADADTDKRKHRVGFKG